MEMAVGTRVSSELVVEMMGIWGEEDERRRVWDRIAILKGDLTYMLHYATYFAYLKSKE